MALSHLPLAAQWLVGFLLFETYRRIKLPVPAHDTPATAYDSGIMEDLMAHDANLCLALWTCHVTASFFNGLTRSIVCGHCSKADVTTVFHVTKIFVTD
jgi:hypothetical protein